MTLTLWSWVMHSSVKSSPLCDGEKTMGWEINPTVLAVGEFRSKLASGNRFLRSVM